MANEQFTIDLGDQQAVLVTDDDAWLREKLRQEPGSTRVRLRYDQDEVEGHRSGGGLGVRVIAEDLDTEGHAIALHFPSREEADAFRKRLMLTGVLAGTVALGTAAGIGLANMSSPDSQVERQAAGSTGFSAADQAYADRLSGQAAEAVSGLSAADQAYADRLSGQAAAGDTDAASDADDAASGGPSLGGPTPR